MTTSIAREHDRAMLDPDTNSLDSFVRVVQSSLAPVFLLTAVSTLLGVFTTRLARISDQVKALATVPDPESAKDGMIERRLAYLRRRSKVLDLAVVLGALAGACTCGTVLSLFLGLIRAKAAGPILFILFGTAIFCTIGALCAFLFEVLLASRGIRADVAHRVQNIDR